MENARIAVFEDKETIRNFLCAAVETTSHSIIGEAATLQDALQLIEDEEFDVAIVDGNLHPENGYCEDGKEIVAQVRAKKHAAKIIWFSAQPAKSVNIEVDIDTGKDIFGAVEAVDKL
jgi:DNA-binding response OmpR family regulator